MIIRQRNRATRKGEHRAQKGIRGEVRADFLVEVRFELSIKDEQGVAREF